MDKIFNRSDILDSLTAISSKSETHRALICAAFSDSKTKIVCSSPCEDVLATVSCLSSLGASIDWEGDGFCVHPIVSLTQDATLDCGESGSTLRFLLPICAAHGVACKFILRGSLKSRPISPLCDVLIGGGASITALGGEVRLSGRIASGEYTVRADLSSQLISGLLLALSTTEGDSLIRLEGEAVSEPYILLTQDMLLRFGADIFFDRERCIFKIRGKGALASPSRIYIGGDWSNSAFPIVAGIIGKHSVMVSGLDIHTRQGDIALIALLRQMGADITILGDSVVAYPSHLYGISIDASAIPDLVPILAVAASVADGETTIHGASRLKFKESDRIESICSLLSTLGADITPTPDGMIIHGRKNLSGGTVSSFGDHRIAMSAAVASLVCSGEVTICGFEAINKSYPSFADVWVTEA